MGVAAGEIEVNIVGKEEKMANICPCIGELLATMTAMEALEHNASQSRYWMELGEELKKRAPVLYEDLRLEYSGLDSPIKEPLAEWASDAWLLKVEEKCHIKTDDLRKLLTDGLKEMNEGRPQQAYFHYVDAKVKLLDRAMASCENTG